MRRYAGSTGRSAQGELCPTSGIWKIEEQVLEETFNILQILGYCSFSLHTPSQRRGKYKKTH